MPQHNHLVEVGFATIAGRGRAMMSHANLPGAMRNKLCKEAFNTATKLDNLIAIEINGKVKTRYEHFGNSIPKFAKKLRTW